MAAGCRVTEWRENEMTGMQSADLQKKKVWLVIRNMANENQLIFQGSGMRVMDHGCCSVAAGEKSSCGQIQ